MNERLNGCAKRSRHGATLQFRLTALIVLAVLLVLGGGIILDYHRESKRHFRALQASLEEQARALKVARSRIPQQTEFANHVDDFCAQMNEYISPGHHILVLDETGAVSIRARHHSGVDVERALLSAAPYESVISLGKHRLAQVRLEDDDGATFVLAQYLDHMEGILRTQLLSRGLFAGITAAAIILVSYLFINVWVIKPVASLATAARKWANRNFSARAVPFGPADFRFLASEFNVMSEQLENHERNRIAELEQARHIQTNLLPTSTPIVAGLALASEYMPAEHVAGDLYDIVELSYDRTAFVVLDVCGHGISAALLTGVVKMSLHRRLAEEHNLSRAMELVNSDLLSCVPEGRFVTVCVGVWNSSEGSWTYCAAGHPGGVLVSMGKARPLESTASLLGVLPDADWPTNTVSLSPGDRLFLYSDGVVEAGAAGGESEDFGLERVLLKGMDLGLTEQVATVTAEVARRAAGKNRDDATILAFEVLPEAAQ
ncbi:MAG: PP2C family protein-serine/threonine phosphatase [Planctomycetota bacterium]